ncbi:MAG: TonB-dependent receptor [Bacteroidetes bacterium]|nr:TonB-dependent receptor [Bacteroidota bacterium]
MINRIIFIVSVTLILFCGAFHQSAFSQNLKDTLHLNEVEVKSSFAVKNEGFKRVIIDSTFLIHHLDADLSTILNNYSTIFIKSYGNGKLATVSFRGTSANHTDVEWNGISINSPMLGQMDLTQVPVSQFDAIEILYGASGIAKTSGAFGGVINLVTTPDWENRINVRLSQSLASFYTWNTSANIALGNGSFQTITKFNYTNSLNNFLYIDDQTKQWTRPLYSGYNISGVSEELFYRFLKHNFLTAKVWYSQDFKNLNAIEIETMTDRSLRSLIEWKYIHSKYSLTARSAFIAQYQNYKSDTSINNTHQYYSSVNRLRMIWNPWEKLTIRPGVDINFDRVYSDGYSGPKSRSTIGAFSEFNYNFSKKVGMSLVVREDVIDGKFLPLIPALGFNYNPLNKINLTISANISRNYRYPSLNDLYWKLSGNPELKPEQDYSGEMGLTWNRLSSNEKFFIEAQVSGYYSVMYDLILWKPQISSSLWRPENVNEVLARGIETGLNIRFFLGKWSLLSNNNYHYCRSTYAGSVQDSRYPIGSQVMFIPIHQANSSLTIRWREFFGSWNWSYRSGRYDATEYIMPGYALSDIILGKNFIIKKFILSLQLKINNLFDLDYQSIKNYAEPGRNYAFTLRIQFKK